MKRISLISMVLTVLVLVGCGDPSITVDIEESDGSVVSGPGGSLESALMNDTSGEDLLNYWTCSYPASPDIEATSFAFLPDNAGIIFDATQSVGMVYVVTGNVVDISIGGTYFAQFADVSMAADNASFDLTYSFADSSAIGAMFCQLVGERVASGFDQNIYATVTTEDEGITSAWQCGVNGWTPVMFAIWVNGYGVFFNDTYPEGVLLSWSADEQGIYFELGDDAVKVVVSNSRLEDGELVGDSLIIDGENAGSIRCELAYF